MNWRALSRALGVPTWTDLAIALSIVAGIILLVVLL
jgi:hypothetical protein